MRITIQRGDLEIVVSGTYHEDLETNAAEFDIQEIEPAVELTDEEYQALIDTAAERAWDGD